MRLTMMMSLAAAVIAGCAGTRVDPVTRSTALLSSIPAPPGRECRVLPLPPTDVRADLMVDSAALIQAIQSLRDAPGARGYAVLSLLVDENGWNARRTVIDHDLAASIADSVQTLVFTHTRQVEPGEPWGARLRIDMDDGIRFRVGQQEHCSARLRTHDERITVENPFDVRASGPAARVDSNTVLLTLDLDSAGMVTDVRIQRTPRLPQVDRSLLNFARSLTFDPAILDGIPIASTTTVAVRLR